MLWIERFDTLEQLRARVRQFARDYNEHWLLERHSYRTPTETRAHLATRPGGHGMITTFTNKCPVNRVRRTVALHGDR